MADMEALLSRAVAQAVAEAIAPLVERLDAPRVAQEPLTATVDQAAELLQVHPNTIRKMVKEGRLPTVNTGTERTLIARSALTALVAS